MYYISVLYFLILYYIILLNSTNIVKKIWGIIVLVCGFDYKWAESTCRGRVAILLTGEHVFAMHYTFFTPVDNTFFRTG